MSKEIKPYDKRRVAINAYSVIVRSGKSIEAAALDLNISERTVYYWKEGKRSPSIEVLYALSQRFNISIESIIEG